MRTTRRELAEAILSIVEKQSDTKQAAEAIAAYLVRERRTRELDSLLRDIETLRYQKEDVLEVTASSARPLSESSKVAIKALFDAKKIIVHEDIDKTLLGGVRVRALEKSADFSVQARLQRLRKSV